jgi:hypothetical protein
MIEPECIRDLQPRNLDRELEIRISVRMVDRVRIDDEVGIASIIEVAQVNRFSTDLMN